jgi:hemoglobin-like flavoprotein
MGLSEAELDVFHASLARVSTDPRFLDRFYNGFLGRSEEIAAIFAQTDMARLKQKLQSSLHVITLALDDAPGADRYLDYLGRVHERIHIRPELYAQWLDALVGAVRSTDPLFDKEIEGVWRHVLGKGIELMHHAARDQQAAA